MPFICREPPESDLDKLVDDGSGNEPGECVSLVKRLCTPAMPRTKNWKQGASVKNNKSIKYGTAIATFPSGKFKGHAAIYIMQDEKGIYVWDQYNVPKKGVGQRFLPFDDSKSNSNNGNRFYVIEPPSD